MVPSPGPRPHSPPLANASILVLLIIAVAVHYMMTGLGLYFFGGEGLRSSILPGLQFQVGSLIITGQSLAVVVTAVCSWLACVAAVHCSEQNERLPPTKQTSLAH